MMLSFIYHRCHPCQFMDVLQWPVVDLLIMLIFDILLLVNSGKSYPNAVIHFLCRLRSIAAHRDNFVRRLSVRLFSVCLSGSHTFLVVTQSYVSQVTHAFLGMLPEECCHYVISFSSLYSTRSFLYHLGFSNNKLLIFCCSVRICFACELYIQRLIVTF